MPLSFLMPSLEQILFLLGTYQYLFLFPLVVVEGPIATVLAGFLCSLGQLNPFVTYAVVVVADVVGDSLYYVIGRHGGRPFIGKWGRFLGIKTQQIDRLEKHFTHHAGKTLVIGKLTHAVGAVVLVAAGMARVPFWKFVWYNFLPTLPKSFLLFLIGLYFGRSYAAISRYLDATALWTLIAAVCLIVIYFVVKKVSKIYEKQMLDE